MTPSSRTLVICGAIVLVLALAAAALVFTIGQRPVELLAETEPGGVVQRYLMAVERGDYTAADQYIAKRPPSENGLPKPVPDGIPRPLPRVSWRATLEGTRINEPQAEVDVTFYVFRPGAPFSDPVSTYRETFFLVREDSAWRIASPMGLWWLY